MFLKLFCGAKFFKKTVSQKKLIVPRKFSMARRQTQITQIINFGSKRCYHNKFELTTVAFLRTRYERHAADIRHTLRACETCRFRACRICMCGLRGKYVCVWRVRNFEPRSEHVEQRVTHTEGGLLI